MVYMLWTLESSQVFQHYLENTRDTYNLSLRIWTDLCLKQDNTVGKACLESTFPPKTSKTSHSFTDIPAFHSGLPSVKCWDNHYITYV